MRMSLIILFLCSLTFHLGFAQKPVETVPDFIFYKLDNTPFTNRNLTVGKAKLFVFFDVTCDHCRQTIKSLSMRVNECNKISVYLISLDDKTKINEFLNQNGRNLSGKQNVTILMDLREQFINRFRPRKYPSVFLYSSVNKLLLYDDQDLYLDLFFKKINAL